MTGKITMVPFHRCPDPIPLSERACNLQFCQAEWRTSDWGMVGTPSVITSIHVSFWKKRPEGRVVSGSRDLGFEFRWRRNSSHDCTALHCTEPFIITLSLSQYDLYNVEIDEKLQTIIIVKIIIVIIIIITTLK